MISLHVLGHALQGANILWFLDNLGVVSCLCKGSSTVADVGCIIHAFLLKSAENILCHHGLQANPDVWLQWFGDYRHPV